MNEAVCKACSDVIESDTVVGTTRFPVEECEPCFQECGDIGVRTNGLFEEYYQCWMGCGNMEATYATITKFVAVIAISLLSLVLM